MNDPKPPEDERASAKDRRAANIALLVFFAVVVGAGVWLVIALDRHRKLDDCVAQGRRNCAPIEAPR